MIRVGRVSPSPGAPTSRHGLPSGRSGEFAGLGKSCGAPPGRCPTGLDASPEDENRRGSLGEIQRRRCRPGHRPDHRPTRGYQQPRPSGGRGDGRDRTTLGRPLPGVVRGESAGSFERLDVETLNIEDASRGTRLACRRDGVGALSTALNSHHFVGMLVRCDWRSIQKPIDLRGNSPRRYAGPGAPPWGSDHRRPSPSPPGPHDTQSDLTCPGPVRPGSSDSRSTASVVEWTPGTSTDAAYPAPRAAAGSPGGGEPAAVLHAPGA
jgi:hypothetical protein